MNKKEQAAKVKEWTNTLTPEQMRPLLVELIDFAMDAEMVSVIDGEPAPYWCHTGEPLLHAATGAQPEEQRCIKCGGSTSPAYGISDMVMCDNCDHLQDRQAAVLREQPEDPITERLVKHFSATGAQPVTLSDDELEKHFNKEWEYQYFVGDGVPYARFKRSKLFDSVRALFAARAQDIRKQVLEEAAKICDELHGWQSHNNQEYPRSWHEGVDECIDRIRALADKDC